MNQPIPEQPDAAALLATNTQAGAAVFASLGALSAPLQQATQLVLQTLQAGGKLMCCGNGGSACDSAHLSAEIAGRYKIERCGFPALDLTAEHSLISALINDYPPQQVFARQVQALGKPGDVLAVFSTSGASPNVRLALEAAHKLDIRTIAFLGRDGGECRGLADVDLIVPCDVTARIQEAHLLLYHTLCEAIDPILAAM